MYSRESLTNSIGCDALKLIFDLLQMYLKRKLLLKNWKFPTKIEENKLARERLKEFFESIRPSIGGRIKIWYVKFVVHKVKKFSGQEF